MPTTEQWVYEQPDFAAQLKALPQPDTGVYLLRQGMRYDLMYEKDEGQAWMIYYALLDREGNLLPENTVCESEVKAYFRVLNSELRAVHKLRVVIGTRFYVVAGHRIAEGIVTKVLHLADEN